MGLWLVGRRPVLSKSGYSNSHPERHLHVRVPALSMTRPRSLRGYLLTNSFVNPDLGLTSVRDTKKVSKDPRDFHRRAGKSGGGEFT